ncbi:MAG: sodium-dependent transporter, partial [Ectothiorhodospiraceae bacterium]|nr:sodium-dependent transporter [Ectothiorhodospiraceae bacterium]
MPLPRRSLQGEWPGQTVFVLAVAGASIGFGNLWRFPALMAEHGGGAFLLLYLICLLLLGFPLLVAEILVGKGGRQNPVSAYADLAQLHGRTLQWAWVARIGLGAAIVLLLLLTLLGAWALGYAFRSMTGAMAQLDVIDTLSLFQNLQGDVERSLLWVTIFIAVLVCVVSQGVKHGLVPATLALVPTLFLGLLVLMLMAGNLRETLSTVLGPDLSRIDSAALVAALQHAFYTLTVATGAAVAMAAYLPERASPLAAAFGVVLLDTLAAVMASVIVVALLSNAGVAMMSGPTLVFQALPVAFGQLQWGNQMATLFYLV